MSSRPVSPRPVSRGQFSSGDPIADRRADYARMLAESGDHAAAAELTEQALEIAPGWAAGWFRLGEYREKAGIETAAEAYRQALALQPDDVFGARLKLALLGAEAMPDQPPSRYVEGLFDDYADRFDAALVEKLDYSVPGKLAALVAPHAPFDVTVDLGCGTGLFGVEIRGQTRRLEGFDLSANMLARAEAKHLYDHLGQSDLSFAAGASGLFGEGLPRHRADLVSAADVLMYLGSLETVFPLVPDLLAPAGLFAFSVEDMADQEDPLCLPASPPQGGRAQGASAGNANPGGGERGALSPSPLWGGVGEGSSPRGFVLRDSLRYAHSEAYIRALLVRFGLDLLETRRTSIRMDAGKPIHGILFLSRKLG